MKKPLVSIIIPTYNVENYIEIAIESALNQTYSNIEIIIIDDKSTDNTLNIIKKKYLNHPKIQIVEKDRNLGPSNSRNIGIEVSKGKYIALLDSDDYYRKDKIEKQVSFMEKNEDITLSSTYLQCFNLQNNIIKFPLKFSEIKDVQLIGCPIAHPALIVKSSFLKEKKIYYDEKLRYAEDYDFVTRIIEKGAKLETLPQTLYYYRISGNQASFIIKDKKLNINKEQWEISKKIHYKIFQKLVNINNSLYNKNYIDYFLRHESINEFNEIPSYIDWVKKIIECNKYKGEIFSSEFLIQNYRYSILSYFLSKKKLSLKTLIEYTRIRKECSDLTLTYKIKYAIKCIFFLKH